MITPIPPYPAALLKTKNTRIIVIADLHLGWEMALTEKGIHVPTQMPKLLKNLSTIISVHKPERLLILGDVKHTVATAALGEWRDVPDFLTETKKHVKEIDLIRGNHDGNIEPLLPENVKVLPSAGIAVGDVGLFHGHQWPSPVLLGCKTLVMGHIHPVVVFRDPAGFRVTRQVWVKVHCDTSELTRILLRKQNIRIEDTPEKTLTSHYKIKPRTSQLFIMPSFNDFLGGRPLNEKKFRGKSGTEMTVGPILRSKAVNMENAEIYLLDETFLGTLQQLEALS